MVISSRSVRPARLGDVAELERRLKALDPETSVPLLVVRVRDLERLAWREGRAAAKALERKSLLSFVDTADRVMRGGDLLAHDDESEDFVAALISPTRGAGSVATPADCRAALVRLASAMTFGGETRVDMGWTVLHGIDRDLRLTREIETALERGARERERYDFFSTIGHELRTPLTSIRGYLETLIEGGLGSQTSHKFLDVALTEAQRLSRLVDGLFELSVLDMRTDAVPEESCDVLACIEAAIDSIRPEANLRGTRFFITSRESYDVAINDDRLMQIFINILENAVKHGRTGGRVEISLFLRDARYLEIRFDDDGPGVDPDERDAVFSFAKRGAKVTARGAGIGLAIVRLMTERASGEADVTSSPLGGARFRIRLPIFGRGEG